MMKCTPRDLCKSVFVLFLLISLSFCCNADPQKTYGSASVKTIKSVSGDLSFTCDVKDWPPVIGSDVKVIVKDVEPPGILTANDAADGFYFQRVKDFVRKILKSAKTIEIKNIARANEFALKANVVIDGKNLARQLIDAGLAQVKSVKTADKDTKPNPNNANDNRSLVASKSGKVFHTATCSFAKRISQENLMTFNNKAQAQEAGRRPCKTCKP